MLTVTPEDVQSAGRAASASSSTAEVLGLGLGTLRHARGDRHELSRRGPGDDASGARRMACAFPVFTLDTGLLFPETIELKKRLEDFFGYQNRIARAGSDGRATGAGPGPRTLETRSGSLLHDAQGSAAAETSLRTRLLDHRLAPRSNPTPVATLALLNSIPSTKPPGRDIVKLNPMANWSREAVWKYIRDHKHSLQSAARSGLSARLAAGRARSKTAAGENERAGRWTGFQQGGMRHSHVHAEKGMRSPEIPQSEAAANSGRVAAITHGLSFQTRKPEHLHPARGVQQVRKPRDALEHRQGLDRAALAGAQGVLRPCPLPARCTWTRPTKFRR